MEIKLKSRYWKTNIDKRLHLLMRELTLRQRPTTKKSIADQYETAIDAFLQRERIPKQVEKRDLTSIRFEVSEEFLSKIHALRLIARKKRVPLAYLIENLLEEYLDKPENYLGKTFYERHKRHIESIK